MLDVTGTGRRSRRQFGPVEHLELKSGVELAEVVQECQNGQPCSRHLIDAVLSGRPFEPSPNDGISQQRLEARRHVGAMVLQTVKARR
ncbi:MAG: hypothetical protein OXH96_07390 [Spirochaetaceae bacterium]|nr:hypothetical protein [Spirochaetaceae bacterium]